MRSDGASSATASPVESAAAKESLHAAFDATGVDGVGSGGGGASVGRVTGRGAGRLGVLLGTGSPPNPPVRGSSVISTPHPVIQTQDVDPRRGIRHDCSCSIKSDCPSRLSVRTGCVLRQARPGASTRARSHSVSAAAAAAPAVSESRPTSEASAAVVARALEAAWARAAETLTAMTSPSERSAWT